MVELSSQVLPLSASAISKALADIESSIASPLAADSDVEAAILRHESIYVRLCDLRVQPAILPSQLARCVAIGVTIRRWLRTEIDKVIGVHREESMASRERAAAARDELGRLQIELISAQRLAEAAKKIIDEEAKN